MCDGLHCITGYKLVLIEYGMFQLTLIESFGELNANSINKLKKKHRKQLVYIYPLTHK